MLETEFIGETASGQICASCSKGIGRHAYPATLVGSCTTFLHSEDNMSDVRVWLRDFGIQFPSNVLNSEQINHLLAFTDGTKVRLTITEKTTRAIAIREVVSHDVTLLSPLDFEADFMSSVPNLHAEAVKWNSKITTEMARRTYSGHHGIRIIWTERAGRTHFLQREYTSTIDPDPTKFPGAVHYVQFKRRDVERVRTSAGGAPGTLPSASLEIDVESDVQSRSRCRCLLM